MTKRIGTAAVSIAALLFISGCGSDDSGGANKSGDSSTASETETSSEADVDAAESSEGSEDPAAPSTREQLPASAPEGFTPDDLSQIYDFGYILAYTNQYPGWVKLSTEEPEYDAALGGYVVQAYFTVDAGYDIILTKEWSLEAGGQKVIASDPPAETGVVQTWLPVRTPLGNHPEAMQNYIFGDLLFVMPQSDQPLTMRYDNVDGDVHATWQKGGYGA